MLKTRAGHISLGQSGEDWASNFLQQKGFLILARNWRYRHLELDIVARDGETTVFIEVKTRTSTARGEPSLAVTTAKQRKLVRAAQAWLATHQCWQIPCRFDIIALVGVSPHFRVEHYRHAFEFSETLGRCNSHWQPW